MLQPYFGLRPPILTYFDYSDTTCASACSALEVITRVLRKGSTVEDKENW